MSKYTTEIRRICESYAGNPSETGYSTVKDIIEAARAKVFSFEYPIFDPAYKGVLETKILKHFYTREIAFESVGLFLLKLDTRMNEIMPYYNKLYRTETLEFNPLHDFDVSRTHKNDLTTQQQNEGSASGTSSASSNQSQSNTREETRRDSVNGSHTDNTTRTYQDFNSNTGSKTTAHSDTPQGELDDLTSMRYLSSGDVENNDLHDNNNGHEEGSAGGVNASQTDINDSITDETAVAASSNQSNSLTNASNTSITSVEDYIETVSGKQGGASYSALLTEYRSTLLNIDMQIIDDLKDLFFTLY